MPKAAAGLSLRELLGVSTESSGETDLIKLTPSNGNAAVLASDNCRLTSTDVERRQVLSIEGTGTVDDFGVESKRLGAVENGLGTLAEGKGSHKGESNGCGKSLD